MECNRVLSWIFVATKNIMLLINIVAPVLLIISLAYKFSYMAIHPEDKKMPKKIKNSVISLVVVFMIPFSVNLVMSWCDKNYDISKCITNAKSSNTSKYSNTDEDRKQIISDPDKYEKSK